MNVVYQVTSWASLGEDELLTVVNETTRPLSEIYTDVNVGDYGTEVVLEELENLVIVGKKEAMYQCITLWTRESNGETVVHKCCPHGPVELLIDSNGNTWITEEQYEEFV